MADLDVACEVEVSSSSPSPLLVSPILSTSTSSSSSSGSSGSSSSSSSGSSTGSSSSGSTSSQTTSSSSCSDISAPNSNYYNMESEENGDDVVCVGEYRPTSAILPCFLPCCKDTFANRVIPVRLMHASENAATVRPCYSGIIMQDPVKRKRPSHFPGPVRPCLSGVIMQESKRKRTSLFPEPPESEWTPVTVYHWDPRNEVLRYKCRICSGLIERRSFKSRLQFSSEQLPNQCVNCSQNLQASQLNQPNNRQSAVEFNIFVTKPLI